MTSDKIRHDILASIPSSAMPFLKEIDFADLREIRLRAGRKTVLYYGKTAEPVGRVYSSSDISEIFTSICRNSVYAYLDEIKNGFITLPGGHRIGFGGECVTENGKITNIHNICSINIRLAREFKGCAAPLINHIKSGGIIKNTILIAPPACGKTTMLRDIARMLSFKNKVTVIDERSELSAPFCGNIQFDLGPQTDIISRIPKSLGIIMALRALSPDIIITDEVGSKDDMSALEQLLGAGCKIITSIHGYSADSIKKSKGQLLLLFDTIIELTKRNGIPEISRVLHTEDFTYD
ncbi:MAG: stage III sporulation protein AA [Ruminococcaceae bacterium]|nr:stage III sporulation protein AA [Oscillospiraceae bacterium]